LFPPILKLLDGLCRINSLFAHEIGDYQGGASADSCHAVNQDVSFLSSFFDEGEGLIEELGNVVAWVILCLQDEVALEMVGDRGKACSLCG
jgi:hypothetical protein